MERIDASGKPREVLPGLLISAEAFQRITSAYLFS